MKVEELPNGIVRVIIPPNCDILEYEAELARLFDEGFPLKVTLENMSGQTHWKLDEVKGHFERVRKHASGLTPNHAVAIVAQSPLDFGQGKMAQGALALVFPCKIEVFHDLESATEWLLSTDRSQS